MSKRKHLYWIPERCGSCKYRKRFFGSAICEKWKIPVKEGEYICQRFKK